MVTTKDVLLVHHHVAGIARVHAKHLATMHVILRVKMIVTPHVQDRLLDPPLALIACILVRGIAKVHVLDHPQVRHLAQDQVALQPALVVAQAVVVAVVVAVVRVVAQLAVVVAVPLVVQASVRVIVRMIVLRDAMVGAVCHVEEHVMVAVQVLVYGNVLEKASLAVQAHAMVLAPHNALRPVNRTVIPPAKM